LPPPEPARISPDKQTARLRVEKRPKGKVVTVVRGLDEPEAALGDLAAKLKAACGSGGTSKDGEIEIQGDHLARVETSLGKLGYRVRRGS
jgi:translation initiation factor 1